MDVYNAFLQGDLKEEVFMQFPPRFGSQGGDQACRLLKSLNGLKQASRKWNLKITNTLLSAGFIQSQQDHSLFVLKRNSRQVIIIVYVDDLLITGDDKDLIQEAKCVLHAAFKIKDLGPLKYFSGIEICRSKKGILLCQRKYTLELIAELGLGGCKPTLTPLEQNQKLTSLEYDQQCGGLENDPHLPNVRGYQMLIGKLLYLTLTRPDIAYSVQTLSQFMQDPKKSHLEVAHRVVRYLKNEPGLGVLMHAEGKGILTVFCDADWARCPNSRRSVTGYTVKLGQSLISWKSKKQNTVASCLAESEYRSMALTVSELIWLIDLFKCVGVDVPTPIQLFTGSKSAMQIANNPVFPRGQSI
ncbi:uncharacterized mitochondrial protein AtMg00810-like [Solanum tuberosum]|uniref:uncharacterized mitochondrial protein AtMg00810-like n=1 Tax=Solanum tuberosum TaxID=4113 RepID=UPI00073A48BE|nr:PREDICTED: uncharacterized mitochondrial protein AtMg00810-like [Solanum tuberosum]